jgi:hypothetical protein
MEDLIKTISEKAGISADQSKSALTVVLGLLKEKMPDALGGQLEGLLTGKELDWSSIVKEVSADKLGDLKGAASEKIDDLKDSFKKLF